MESLVKDIPINDVRIALGALRRLVLRRMLGETMVLAAIGVGLGVAGAIAVVALVALFAGWWPARTASKIDPITAIRHD